jgi:hypothetical protein
MWRLRQSDDAFFERYYTKLIRYVTQGRLLRDSNRGVLLVDAERCSLGDTVVVRASLTDPQFQPLSLPEVPAVLAQPGGARTTIDLRRVEQAAREGMYSGQFTAMLPGNYRIELALPGMDDEVLTRDVSVQVPDLEIERPERNDPVLTDIARQTGGAYYVGMAAVMGRKGAAALANVITPKDQQTYLPGTPDVEFERRLMSWLLAFLCIVLCAEWLIRRIHKLA